MNEDAEDGKGPRLSPRGEAARRERERQQAQAMRANLQRRKAQLRGREAEERTPDGTGEPSGEQGS
jgi:hypothetical protein